MNYLAKLIPDGAGYVVTFPAIPEANTGGETEAEALANAQDAMEVALLTYAADGRDLPVEAKNPGEGGTYRQLSVPATIAAKLAFIEAFRESGMTRVALAARIGKAEGEIRRMLDPYHPTKLKSIEAVLRVLGKRLVVTVEEAA